VLRWGKRECDVIEGLVCFAIHSAIKSLGETAGSQDDDCHRKQSKILLGYKTVPNLSAYLNKENLLDVTAWFYIQTRKITSNTTNVPKHKPLGKLIPTRCGIRLPFGSTNGERVMC
jgi:hypothetical protein